jgi:hypothetical protein
MRYYRIAASKDQAEEDVRDMAIAGLDQVATMNLGRYHLTTGRGGSPKPLPRVRSRDLTMLLQTETPDGVDLPAEVDFYEFLTLLEELGIIKVLKPEFKAPPGDGDGI